LNMSILSTPAKHALYVVKEIMLMIESINVNAVSKYTAID